MERGKQQYTGSAHAFVIKTIFYLFAPEQLSKVRKVKTRQFSGLYLTAQVSLWSRMYYHSLFSRKKPVMVLVLIFWFSRGTGTDQYPCGRVFG